MILSAIQFVMASAVKPSWGSYAILAYALLLECLFVRPSSAGSFSNCCNITRCKNVTAVCSDYEPCASACLSHLSGRAKGSPPLPVVDCQDQAVLSLLDYGCMARTLNGTGAAPSLVDDVCGQKYRPGLAPAAPFTSSPWSSSA
ncbi:hypothetical protein VTK73DRAFT_9319 [Phialemonium thermophilum]|uniref:Uncharacterized protein n=1 Tax=Phialemonium thermophilum TaxID=223376 RepID=A0ABR3W3B8_9PEZI